MVALQGNATRCKSIRIVILFEVSVDETRRGSVVPAIRM